MPTTPVRNLKLSVLIFMHNWTCKKENARARTHVPQRTRAYTGTTTDSGTGCLFKPEACPVSLLDGLQLFPSDLCSWKPAWSCYWPSSIWLFFGFPLPAYVCCWFMLLNNGGYCTIAAPAATSVSSARMPLCSYMTLGAEHLVPPGGIIGAWHGSFSHSHHDYAHTSCTSTRGRSHITLR